jgi:XisI protein
MDRVNSYASIVQQVVQEYYDLYKTMEDAETFLLTEPNIHHYQVIQTGWDRHHRRIYTTLHISIQNEKVYIHSDPTEEGIANILIGQGIPSSHIVLEYQSPNLRSYTPFATV